jgi:hypothetical protein
MAVRPGKSSEIGGNGRCSKKTKSVQPLFAQELEHKDRPPSSLPLGRDLAGFGASRPPTRFGGFPFSNPRPHQMNRVTLPHMHAEG